MYWENISHISSHSLKEIGGRGQGQDTMFIHPSSIESFTHWTFLWLDVKYFPRDSFVWTFGPQLLVLFWETIEPLGAQGLTGRSSCWGMGARVGIHFFSLVSFPVYILIQPGISKCLQPCLLHHDGLYPVKPWTKINLSLIKVLLSDVLSK